MTTQWPEEWTLGTRIVVRYRTGGTAISGRPELTDIIGHVCGGGPTAVAVERRDGVEVTVQRSDVVSWKPVPEAPDQRRR